MWDWDYLWQFSSISYKKSRTHRVTHNVIWSTNSIAEMKRANIWTNWKGIGASVWCDLVELCMYGLDNTIMDPTKIWLIIIIIL